MRPLILVSLVFGCGSSSRTSAQAPLAPPAQAIDVAEVGPLPIGTKFTTSLHRKQWGGMYGWDQSEGEEASYLNESAQTTLDATYSFHVVSDDRLVIAFEKGFETRNGTPITWPMQGRTYHLDERGLMHSDGTPLSEEEETAIAAFAEDGGFGLPVREALAGERVDADSPLALDADTVSELVLIGTPTDVTGEAKLRGVDDDGIATLDFDATGTIPELSEGTWQITGSVTLEAATLRPRKVDYVVDMNGYIGQSNASMSGTNHVESTQTFAYE